MTALASLRERFWSKLDAQLPLVGCWEWRGARNADGRELDHTCRNRGCIRPDHLEPVDQATNVRRAVLA